MHELLIEFLEMTDRQLEPDDETTVTVKITNLGEHIIKVKKIEVHTLDPKMQARKNADTEPSDYVYIDIEQFPENHLLEQGADFTFTFDVLTRGTVVGEKDIQISLTYGYHIAQPQAPCVQRIQVEVSPD